MTEAEHYPKTPGHYWAQWRIASPATNTGATQMSELTLSQRVAGLAGVDREAVRRSIASLRPIGRALFGLGAIRCYCDGDSVGFVWRWWHPLAWALIPAVIAASVLLEGIPQTWRDRHDLGLGMKPWFAQNPHRLVWISQRDAALSARGL